MALVDVGGAVLDVVQHGAGRDLVLLHTLLSDRSVFDRVVPDLARTRRLWLPNLPGFGASSPAGPAIDDYADRVAGLFRALGLPKATDVVANGFGGHVAIGLAARHGRLFDRLVIADAVAAFSDDGRRQLRVFADRVREGGMAGAAEIAIRRTFTEPFIAAHPDVIADRTRRLLAFDPAPFHTACLALERMDYRPVLAAIGNPTLVMVGALDTTTPPALARELAAGIPGAAYLEIPDCAHCPPIEKPEAFVSAVTRFLAGGSTER